MFLKVVEIQGSIFGKNVKKILKIFESAENEKSGE